MNLMTTYGNKICTDFSRIYRYLSVSLYSINMHINLRINLFNTCSYLFNRFDGTYLIIYIHAGNEDCILSHRIKNFLRINDTFIICSNKRNFEPKTLQKIKSCMNRCMLNLC